MNTRKSLSLAGLCLFALLIAISGGCRKKVAPVAPPEPPAPAPTAKPTATISASPTTVQKGKSSTLSWTTTNATNVAIDQGIGDVSTNGSRSVSPSSSITYTLNARSAGGTATASARVTVTTPPPPPARKPRDPTVEELFSQKVKDIYFNYDQSDVRDDSRTALATTAQFLKQYPNIRFTIEGHCDERGTAEYNLALGERRALAARDYLISLGISEDRLRTVSYGEEFPFAPGQDEEAWQLNRRAHFIVTAQ